MTIPDLAVTPTPQARADFLRQLGRLGEARSDYEKVRRQCDNDVERIFLQTRLDGLSSR